MNIVNSLELNFSQQIILENVQTTQENEFQQQFYENQCISYANGVEDFENIEQLEDITQDNDELIEEQDITNQQTDNEDYISESNDELTEEQFEEYNGTNQQTDNKDGDYEENSCFSQKSPPKSSIKKNQEILQASNQQLECSLCSEKLENFLKLKIHFRKVHNTNGYTHCCGKKFAEANKYADHLNVHANPDYFKCPECSRVLSNRICFNYHMEQHKPKEERHLPVRKKDIKGIVVSCPSKDSEQISSKRKNEIILNTTNYELECSICGENLPNFLELRAHFRAEHNCAGYTYCCGKKFTEPHKFADHLNVHANPDFFKCPECSRVLANRICFKYHMEMHKPEAERYVPPSKQMIKHKSSKKDNPSAKEKNKEILNSLNNQFVCNICSDKVIGFYELKEHFRNNHATRGYTMCCGRKFFEAGQLIDHLHVHANPDYFKCNVCSKILANRTCYKYHMETHDPTKLQERKFCCEECGKGFATRKDCALHKLIHTPEEMRKFECTECSKRYPTQRLLKSHMNVAHFSKYYRICDICGKSLRDLATFKRHKEEHEKGEATKFPCDLCGIELKNRILLNRHKKFKHQEENLKPQKCPHCEKIISCKWSLIQHINYAHKTARKHHCEFCGKSFKLAKHLKEHLSIHTGESIFTCTYCSEKFRSSSKYYTHRKEAHTAEYENECLKRQPKYNSALALQKETQLATEALKSEYFASDFNEN